MLGLPKRTMVVILVLVGVAVLYVIGSDKQPGSAAGGGGSAATPAANAQCRVTVTADVLKVRANPDVKAAQVGSFKQNAEVDAEKVVQNGYRKLSEGHWVSNDFVKPMQGRDC